MINKGGRPTSKGFDFFPHSTQVDNDDNFLLFEEDNPKYGYMFYFKLLERIYAGEGFFINFGEREQRLFSRKSKIPEDEIYPLIQSALNESLFDKELFLGLRILTSRKLQQTYFSMCKKRRSIRFSKEISLLSASEIKELTQKTQEIKYISLYDLRVCGTKTQVCGTKTQVCEPQTMPQDIFEEPLRNLEEPLRNFFSQSKVKESKVKESKVSCLTLNSSKDKFNDDDDMNESSSLIKNNYNKKQVKDFDIELCCDEVLEKISNQDTSWIDMKIGFLKMHKVEFNEDYECAMKDISIIREVMPVYLVKAETTWNKNKDFDRMAYSRKLRLSWDLKGKEGDELDSSISELSSAITQSINFLSKFLLKFQESKKMAEKYTQQEKQDDSLVLKFIDSLSSGDLSDIKREAVIITSENTKNMKISENSALFNKMVDSTVIELAGKIMGDVS